MRWRWKRRGIGHTLRKPVNRTTRQALTWNPRVWRKWGRARNTWRRDLEADVKDNGYVELETLTCSRICHWPSPNKYTMDGVLRIARYRAMRILWNTPRAEIFRLSGVAFLLSQQSVGSKMRPTSTRWMLRHFPAKKCKSVRSSNLAIDPTHTVTIVHSCGLRFIRSCSFAIRLRWYK